MDLTIVSRSPVVAAALFALAACDGAGSTRSGVLPIAIPGSEPDPLHGVPIELTEAEYPADAAPLRLGVTPYVEVAEIRRIWTPIAKYIGRQLNVEVQLIVAGSYQDLIDRVVRGEVHVAAMSPLSYVMARERLPELQLVASQIANGAPYFSSIIIVRADDPAKTLQELRGAAFAFVDRASTSGYLMPYHALLREGITPERAFETIVYSGTHSQSIRDVASGRVRAAAVASGMLGLVASSGDVDIADLRMLANVGRIRYDAICLGPHVSPAAARKIQQAFLRLSVRTVEGRQVLRRNARIQGWVRAEDAHYDYVRRVRQELAEYHATLPAPQPP